MAEINPENIKAVWSDAILVRLQRKEEKKGELYIPEASRDKVSRKVAVKATVVQVGQDVDFYDLRHPVKPGDTVYFDPIALDCPSFTHEKERYIFIRDEDLLAKEVA